MEIDTLLERFKIKTKNKEIYRMAFTHSSFNSDANTHHHDYERLEFIGDSVLGFTVSSLLYKNHPEMLEGELSKAKAALVQSKALAKYAVSLGYPDYIRAGNSISRDELIHNKSILEDVFEAVIGAIYLDKGIDFVYKFIENIFLEDIINFKMEDIKDYKSALQEAYQSEHRESVKYRVVKETGPSHDKTFFVEVLFNDLILGRGFGKSKKEAEQAAAKNALDKKAV